MQTSDQDPAHPAPADDPERPSFFDELSTQERLVAALHKVSRLPKTPICNWPRPLHRVQEMLCVLEATRHAQPWQTFCKLLEVLEHKREARRCFALGIANSQAVFDAVELPRTEFMPIEEWERLLARIEGARARVRLVAVCAQMQDARALVPLVRERCPPEWIAALDGIERAAPGA